ncbi:hypothetical protein D1012_21700 [Pseudotabrizicola alkalilacus]|uniref:Uncharacterized protein n=2 Tax=Pseudotabrizicola alkalilacus TaxID=2305252 RepID=A0A411YW60_9RHOB|nr:hypothetical protein D1012_21700 [Pseudotabrizicola alkalilacus]
MKFAKEKYEVEFRNPNLILVVGHAENMPPEEVGQAMRQYHGGRLIVIDYDTLISGAIVAPIDS